VTIIESDSRQSNFQFNQFISENTPISRKADSESMLCL